MLWRVELSDEAVKQFLRFPEKIRRQITRAIDELEERDEAQWTNVKALHGPQWKGRYRQRAGDYRIIFSKLSEHGTVQISAILRRSASTYL
jgi:mRNA-degrading endonuclease RelE of RelBE toxin-antitoxin system